MSLTLVYCYIIVGIFGLLFINYKFLKLFFSAKSKAKATAVSSNGTAATLDENRNDVWSIPGPIILPIIGTKWIYLWKYKMSKIHEVYQGEYAVDGYMLQLVGVLEEAHSNSIINKINYIALIFNRIQSEIWSNRAGSDSGRNTNCESLRSSRYRKGAPISQQISISTANRDRGVLSANTTGSLCQHWDHK